MSDQAGILSDAALDTVCRCAVFYLALPVALFFACWLKLPISLLVNGLFLYLLSSVFVKKSPDAGVRRAAKPSLTVAVLLSCAALAIAYALICFPAWDAIASGDAMKHGTILADLARERWPVVYFKQNDSFTILKYSFAYYLVPAALAKLVGLNFLNYALVAWTATGVFLFLLMAVGHARTRLGAGFALATAVLFSGLCAIYILATSGDNAGLWSSLFSAWAKGWGNFWMIGSHPFELRWSPQHALSSWLAAGVIYYCHREVWLQKSLAVITVTLALWSPFVAVAFMVFLAIMWLQKIPSQTRENWPAWLTGQLQAAATLKNGIALCLLAGVLIFLTTDSAAIQSHLFILLKSPEVFFSQYIIFIAVEFGILVLAIRYACGPLGAGAWAAVMLLMALPFTHVGVSGDLQMRGSQLPFTYLMLVALSSLGRAKSRSARNLIGLIVVVGLVGGMQELARPKWTLDLSRDSARYVLPMPLTDFEAYQAYIRPQYLASIPQSSVLARFFLDLDKGHRPLQIQTVLTLQDFNFSEYGVAPSDKNKKRIESEKFADAGLVSQDIVLPAGWYKVDIVGNWDLVSSEPHRNAAHISLHGKKMLIPIDSSKASAKHLSATFYSSGETVRLSFGLGGWTAGKGFIELTTLTLASIKAM